MMLEYHFIWSKSQSLWPSLFGMYMGDFVHYVLVSPCRAQESCSQVLRFPWGQKIVTAWVNDFPVSYFLWIPVVADVVTIFRLQLSIIFAKKQMEGDMGGVSIPSEFFFQVHAHWLMVRPTLWKMLSSDDKRMTVLFLTLGSWSSWAFVTNSQVLNHYFAT